MSEKRAPLAREVRVVLPGLMLAIMLAMLDNLIVATAMPRIVGELGGLSHLAWVVTAYTLGTAVSTPLWGKIGDLYGRKGSFITAVVIFLVGSALSGAAPGMIELIAFRAIQGLGAGGLMVGVMAIIGDLIPPRERGRVQGWFAGIMAIAMVGGPLVGGFLTDHLSWRWAFYINLPLGAVTLLVLATRLHLPKRRSEHRIDWLGAGLLSAGITALTLITTWGGHQYGWASAQIMLLAVLAVAALGWFFVVERRVPEPILPLSIFTNRNFALVSAIGFLVGFIMYGAINYLPLFQQTVQGASATNSGLLVLPLMGGLLLTSLISGQAITRTGRYRIFPILGGVLMVAGLLLLTRLSADTTRVMSALFMLVFGAGLGFLMQNTTLISQNSVHPKDMGVASSTSTFMRSIGGSFGVALFGAIFASNLRTEVAARLGTDAAAQVDKAGGNLDPTVLSTLPATVQDGFHHAIAFATSHMFWWAVPIAVITTLLTLFIKEHPLRGFETREPTPETDSLEPSLTV
ncbi:MAG TPA: MDR family MFS transporter [Mycobacteriales bacterium]|nr:MDR family MFS transporter [Mycobacteriales bacterium]